MSDADVFEWEIVDKITETPSATTFVFSTTEKMDFSVGQFVTVGSNLKRPTASGGIENEWVERAYSVASSPTRDTIDLTVKFEKPYGHISPTLKKPDGFAAYFNEQMGIGDRVKVRLHKKRDHFLYKIVSGVHKDIAYWSGANGAESARGLIQLMEDKPELGIKLLLFYSNPHLYVGDTDKTVNVIYYNWLLEKVKKMEHLKVVFTFTRDSEIPASDHPRVIFRKGRFFVDPDGNPERTLTKFVGTSHGIFNPICGSSGFINGVVRDTEGKLQKNKGVSQSLVEIEGVKPDMIDREQFYLDHASVD